jgi:hypothetical protein
VRLSPREGVAWTAQWSLVLAPLPVAFPLGLPCPGPLLGLLVRLALPLLGTALGLFLLTRNPTIACFYLRFDSSELSNASLV